MKFFKEVYSFEKTAGVDLIVEGYSITPEELHKIRKKSQEFSEKPWEWEKEEKELKNLGYDAFDFYEVEEKAKTISQGSKLIHAYAWALDDLTTPKTTGSFFKRDKIISMFELVSSYGYDDENNKKFYTKENAQRFLDIAKPAFEKYKNKPVKERGKSFEAEGFSDYYIKEDDKEFEDFLNTIEKLIKDPKVKAIVIELV